MTPMPVPGARAAFRWPAARDPAAAARLRPGFPERRDNPPPPVRRVHCATPGSGSRVRSPVPAAAGSAAGWHPKPAGQATTTVAVARRQILPARPADCPWLTVAGRGSLGSPPRLIAGRASSRLLTWLSSGTALAKPNWPTTGVPSGRPVQMPIRYRALRPTAHASR